MAATLSASYISIIVVLIATIEMNAAVVWRYSATACIFTLPIYVTATCKCSIKISMYVNYMIIHNTMLCSLVFIAAVYDIIL